MISIQQCVTDIVSQTPLLEDALAKKLMNLSALAREIKPQIERMTVKEVQNGSIIMALKRISATLQPSKELSQVFKITPDLVVRSNLIEITIANSDALIGKQKKLIDYAGGTHAAFTTITYGVFETTIIANHAIKEKIITMFRDETILSHIENLSSITIRFPEDIIVIPGVYYQVLKALSWEGIDIVEVVSTYSEFTIILKHQLVDRAFSIIKRLFSNH